MISSLNDTRKEVGKSIEWMDEMPWTITDPAQHNLLTIRSRGTRWVPRVVLGLPFPKLTVQAQETNRQQEAGHLTAGDRSVISVPVGVPRLGSYFLGCPVIAGVGFYCN